MSPVPWADIKVTGGAERVKRSHGSGEEREKDGAEGGRRDESILLPPFLSSAFSMKFC